MLAVESIPLQRGVPLILCARDEEARPWICVATGGDRNGVPLWSCYCLDEAVYAALRADLIDLRDALRDGGGLTPVTLAMFGFVGEVVDPLLDQVVAPEQALPCAGLYLEAY